MCWYFNRSTHCSPAVSRTPPAVTPVRLTEVEAQVDPLGGQFRIEQFAGQSTDVAIVRIAWALADALPFDLPVTTRHGASVLSRISVARGNVVLADHGLRIKAELLPAVTSDRRYRPNLQESDLTFGVPYADAAARQEPAGAIIQQDPHHALPVLTLTEDANAWRPCADLLASSWFSRDFVVEMDNQRTAWLRFGDGTYGERPPPGHSLWRTTASATVRLATSAVAPS